MSDLAQRVAVLRRRVLSDLTEVFADLEDLVDPNDPGGLVTLCARYERERDEARAQVAELRTELAKRPRPSSIKAEHFALIADAATTLRNAVHGIASMPMSSVDSARAAGQANKAVVAFDEQTKGLI